MFISIREKKQVQQIMKYQNTKTNNICVYAIIILMNAC